MSEIRKKIKIQNEVRKIKKFFSIAAPTVNLRKKGDGVSSQKVPQYILGG